MAKAIKDGLNIDNKHGIKLWGLNGMPHRVDRPAIEWPNGNKEWQFKGKLHRIDGPAVEFANGEGNGWWIDGVEYEEEEFNNHPLVIAHREKKQFEKSINEAKQSNKVKL